MIRKTSLHFKLFPTDAIYPFLFLKEKVALKVCLHSDVQKSFTYAKATVHGCPLILSPNLRF